MSRREAIGRVASVALPLVTSVIVPTPLEAASGEYSPTSTCSIIVDPSSAVVPGTGGSASFLVVATCNWTVSSNASWLTVDTASGGGNSAVRWSAEANPLPTSRIGTITVSAGNNATVTVTQAASGTTCNLRLSPTSGEFPFPGGGGSVGVTTNCAWTATAGSSWLSVTNGSGSGDGHFLYDLSENGQPLTRNGVISVVAGGTPAEFAVRQTGRPVTDFNGPYRGTATLRLPYGCGNFFVRSYEAAATVTIETDGGTVKHESITGGYYRLYRIRSVTVLPNGDIQIVCYDGDWIIGNVAFRGALQATISGRNYREEERLARADGTCTDYFDTVATKV